MDNQERLPDELLFEADGHVTEVVLACLADGELALVPDAAAAHVDGCDTCTARLGAAALRSLSAGEALLGMGAAAARPASVAFPAPVAFPVAFPAPAPRPAQAARVELVQIERAAAPASSPRARRPPYAAIGAALLVAIAASAPGIADAAAAIQEFLRSVPILVRVVVNLMRGAPEGLLTAALLVRWVSALVLITTGWVVARTMSPERPLQGGMR